MRGRSPAARAHTTRVRTSGSSYGVRTAYLRTPGELPRCSYGAVFQFVRGCIPIEDRTGRVTDSVERGGGSAGKQSFLAGQSINLGGKQFAGRTPPPTKSATAAHRRSGHGSSGSLGFRRHSQGVRKELVCSRVPAIRAHTNSVRTFGSSYGVRTGSVPTHGSSYGGRIPAARPARTSGSSYWFRTGSRSSYGVCTGSRRVRSSYGVRTSFRSSYRAVCQRPERIRTPYELHVVRTEFAHGPYQARRSSYGIGTPRLEHIPTPYELLGNRTEFVRGPYDLPVSSYGVRTGGTPPARASGFWMIPEDWCGGGTGSCSRAKCPVRIREACAR